MPSVQLDPQTQARTLTRQKTLTVVDSPPSHFRGSHPYNTGARPRPLALQPTLLVGDDGEVLENQPSPAPQIWAHRGVTKQFSPGSSVSSIGSPASTITARPDNGDRQYIVDTQPVGDDGEVVENQPSPSPQIWAHRGLTKQFSRESSVSSIYSSASTSKARPDNGDRRYRVDTQRSSCTDRGLPTKYYHETTGTSWASHSVFDTPLPYAELSFTDPWHVIGRFLIVEPLERISQSNDNPKTDPKFRGKIIFRLQDGTVGCSTIQGVPLLECINQSQNQGYIKGSEDGVPKSWMQKATGTPKMVRIEITWPGYPNMLWRFSLPVDNEGLSVRSMATIIAVSVHQLISAVEMHEKSIVIGAPFDLSLIGQKSLWRLGGRGTAIEKIGKINLVSLDWAYGNVFHPVFSLSLEG